ncbi:hypothetical protein G7Y89_g893 [Cudoniella acicularis]|uniref:Heterokaryon incompatibility domain-containing protein n=1 Tax=Cudoniella acicularis TaxID=354080 RepID=A0A8H4RWA9_9HELO|nr:hypothetical protein G7Y89_g893 [Cudoniella acicularis]
MPLCKSCANLDLLSLFKWPEGSDGKVLRTWSPLSLQQSSETCDLCHSVLKLINFHDRLLLGTHLNDRAYRLLVGDYGLIISNKSGGIINPGDSGDDGTKNYESVTRLSLSVDVANRPLRIPLPCGLQMASPDSSDSRLTVLRGREVGEVVDMELVSRWIQTCRESHGIVCTPRHMSKEVDDLMIRVIDIERLCIVTLPGRADYVALSYVWGATEQLRLLQENYKDFTQEFGLRSQVNKLPRTIYDAMDLTGRLRERYLWVDALCIIQDDPADLNIQIQHMNVVYGCATLTIVAAAGSDSNAGLPGLNPKSRDVLSIAREIQGVSLIASLPDFASAISESVWESRGWTMQEKVLSKRLILFAEYQLFYHCNSATWCEDASWESQDPYFHLQPGWGAMSPGLREIGLPHHSLSGFEKYTYLVKGYITRQLSYQSDALNAFAGALTDLSKELNTPFIWGLPASAFDDALSWRYVFQKASQRREGFPSWSWLGWRASERLGDMNFAFDHHRHVKTISVIQWNQVTAEGEVRVIGQPPTPSLELPELKDLPTPRAALNNHHLLFWAQSAHLFVSREPDATWRGSISGHGCYNYAVGVRNADGDLKMFTGIYLHEDWRRAQPDLLEFILIHRRISKGLSGEKGVQEGISLMLVESKQGIHYRVQLVSHQVQESWWVDAQPAWKVIILG